MLFEIAGRIGYDECELMTIENAWCKDDQDYIHA